MQALLEPLSKNELITALMATERPIAFLVGAPFSLHKGIGVPGVDEVITIIREHVQGKVPHAVAELEQAIGGKVGGEGYQAGMKWLGRNLGQDAVNAVISKGVLKARKSGAPGVTENDGEAEDWDIPPGPIALGQLIANHKTAFKGPILTTNFDPLVSLATRLAGARLPRTVLTSDGFIPSRAEDDGASIVHLHGFWRDADTLHTNVQLQNDRPGLRQSLQTLLRGRTLVVLAYGGWDDIFTQSLRDIINDREAQIDVLWCFYENDLSIIEKRYGRLLGEMQQAIIMNRFRMVSGIDCHTILDEIQQRFVGTHSPVAGGGAPATASASPLIGWECIDKPFLHGLKPLSQPEILRYFDGAVPGWRHTQCRDIPVRGEAVRIVERLLELEKNPGLCSLQLIIAAGGEGKSTLLLQAAAQIALHSSWCVLWRPVSDIQTVAENYAKLAADKHWLIVVDDAESIVEELKSVLPLFHRNGVENIHFLLSARDTDWGHANGEAFAWNSWLKRFDDIRLRDLEEEDASLLVHAWESYGEEGLRQLSEHPDTKSRIQGLLSAIQDPAVGDGSFFGGLLQVRFGSNGLREHVIEMLNRLKQRPVAGSSKTLFDAILYISACHAAGLPGIEEKVLSELLDVQGEWIQTRVINPLGEEAAAVRSANLVMTRHSRVAAAILVAAGHVFSVDIAELYIAIVRQTVSVSQRVRLTLHAPIMHLGYKLLDTLPPEFKDRKRREIAIATARAAVDGDPNRISRIVTLGKTHRSAKDAEGARDVFHQHYPNLMHKVDYNTDIRGYFYEWGIAESFVAKNDEDRAAGCWLQVLSIVDLKDEVKLAKEQVILGCTGIATSMETLIENDSESPLAKGVRASIYIMSLLDKSTRGMEISGRLSRKADKRGTAEILDLSLAIHSLLEAVTEIKNMVSPAFMRKLNNPGRVVFSKMVEILQSYERQKRIVLTDAEKDRILNYTPRKRVEDGIRRVMRHIESYLPEYASAQEFEAFARRAVKVEAERLSPKIRHLVAKELQGFDWKLHWQNAQ